MACFVLFKDQPWGKQNNNKPKQKQCGGKEQLEVIGDTSS
ncbi:hypothetical protein GW12_11730 [Acinetobacter sp. HR7]|nr:hypothetical protein GW12_11730 [Acinetobacter sp. HR7]